MGVAQPVVSRGLWTGDELAPAIGRPRGVGLRTPGLPFRPPECEPPKAAAHLGKAKVEGLRWWNGWLVKQPAFMERHFNGLVCTDVSFYFPER